MLRFLSPFPSADLTGDFQFHSESSAGRNGSFLLTSLFDHWGMCLAHSSRCLSTAVALFHSTAAEAGSIAPSASRLGEGGHGIPAVVLCLSARWPLHDATAKRQNGFNAKIAKKCHDHEVRFVFSAFSVHLVLKSKPVRCGVATGAELEPGVPRDSDKRGLKLRATVGAPRTGLSRCARWGARCR
jgi:hypothetical protein